jgi:hypothetical protein
MIVDATDGRCRECGGVLEITDVDDASMSVRCMSCSAEYLVETDAFGDGGMTYYLGFLEEQKGNRP